MVFKKSRRQELLDSIKWENRIKIFRQEEQPVSFDLPKNFRNFRKFVDISNPVIVFDASQFPIETWRHKTQVETWLLGNVPLAEGVPHYIYVYVRGKTRKTTFRKWYGKRRVLVRRGVCGYGHCLLECVSKFIRYGDKIEFFRYRARGKKAPYHNLVRSYWLYKYLHAYT